LRQQYRALHYMQSHGKNARLKTSMAKCKALTGSAVKGLTISFTLLGANTPPTHPNRVNQSLAR